MKKVRRRRKILQNIWLILTDLTVFTKRKFLWAPKRNTIKYESMAALKDFSMSLSITLTLSDSLSTVHSLCPKLHLDTSRFPNFITEKARSLTSLLEKTDLTLQKQPEGKKLNGNYQRFIGWIEGEVMWLKNRPLMGNLGLILYKWRVSWGLSLCQMRGKLKGQRKWLLIHLDIRDSYQSIKATNKQPNNLNSSTHVTPLRKTSLPRTTL